MKRYIVPLIILGTTIVLMGQGSGTPSQLRVRTDATNALMLSSVAQTLPLSQPTLFSNTRLRTDASGNLVVVNSGGSSAPSDAQYWVGAANSELSAEKNLGALSTGLVINTAGVPTAYTGTTCTNQFVRAFSAVGVATCATVTSSDVNTSVWTGTASSGLLKASSQGVLTTATAGTDYLTPTGSIAGLTGTIASAVQDAITRLGTIVSGVWHGTIIDSAYGGTANGFTKFTGPTTAEKTFTLPNASSTILTSNAAVTLGQGGTGLTTAADDTVPLSSGSAWVATAVTNCIDSGGQHLNYTAATNTFSCGTTGASGSNAFTAANPSDPTGRTSDGVAYVMAGIGSSCTITPTSTGVVTVGISGQVQVDTNDSPYYFKLAYGTGTAPANNAAASGTVISGSYSSTISFTYNKPQFGIPTGVSGLTPSTAYWFDLQFHGDGTHLVNFTQLRCVIKEG